MTGANARKLGLEQKKLRDDIGRAFGEFLMILEGLRKRVEALEDAAGIKRPGVPAKGEPSDAVQDAPKPPSLMARLLGRVAGPAPADQGIVGPPRTYGEGV